MHTAEQQLWQSVVLRACLDAFTSIPELKKRKDKNGKTVDNSSHIQQMRRQKEDACSWLSNKGRDFREVCANAGMDADFVSEAWNSGKITLEGIKQWAGE